MNNRERLDWFCRLRSLLREPYMLVALGKDRKKHLAKYDEALSNEIDRLTVLCNLPHYWNLYDRKEGENG